MKTIWKYECPVQDEFELEIPTHHKILSFQAQGAGERLALWVLVDTDTPKEKKKFQIFGTGHPMGYFGNYIGTAQQHGGQLVWHLFEY